MSKTPGRAVAKARPSLAAIKAEAIADYKDNDPDGARGRFAGYKHALESGDTSAIVHVIDA
jgi:hypothetical protein